MARWALRFNDWGPIHLGFRLGHVVRDPQIFRALVYNKGAYVLLMLRSLIGEQAFFDGIRALLSESAYRKIGADDVRRALEDASGRELGPYFDAWIFDTPLPRIGYRLRSEPAGAGSVSVELRAEDLPGPVPGQLTLQTRAGSQIERVTLPPEGGSYRFSVRGPVSRRNFMTYSTKMFSRSLGKP